MSEKIKFAVVGCGHIGKRHAEMITRHSESELVALCDVKNKKDLGLEKFTQEFYSDLNELLVEKKDIDVLSICTPNGLHSDQSIHALKAGINVLCEKPMGLTKDSCQKVIDTAEEYSKQVFCVMQNRYSPASIWLKDMIDNSRLGDIFTVEINCYWNRDERYYTKGNWKGSNFLDGGTLFTQFAHFIDLMYWVFGDINHVKDYEMPTLAPSNKANDYGYYKGSAANHGFVIDNVVDTLKGRTTATTNAQEGMKVVEIIERIYEVRNKQK